MRPSKLIVLSLLLIILSQLLGHEIGRANGGELLPPPELSSIAYAIYDADYDYLILEKNAQQRRSIASITKIMTLLCTIEWIEEKQLSLDTKVTASAKAASREGTQINLRAGDTFSLEELLYATALVSANDAAVALAEYVAGSEADFTRLMNAKAQELGLSDTQYTDCTGLLSIFSNNYSTAADQAKLLQIALHNGLLRKILSTSEYNLKAQNRKIVNSHPLLELPGVEGGKTGATTPAGHTLITSCVRQDRRLIFIVLGARSREVRNAENKELLEWAFNNLRVLISSEEALTSVLIPDGVDHEVNAVLGKEFSVVGSNEGDFTFETEIQILPGLRAPIERGHKVGELVVKREGEEFVRLDLVAQQGTGLATWLRRIYNLLVHFLKGLGR